MAYRAGAELVNVERLEHHAGPKYFTRSGQATWVGVVRDPQGKPVGPYLTRPDRRYSDMIIEVNKTSSPSMRNREGAPCIWTAGASPMKTTTT